MGVFATLRSWGASTHVIGRKRGTCLSQRVTFWLQAAIESSSGALGFSSLPFRSQGPRKRQSRACGQLGGRGTHWAEQLFLFWAAYSQLLLRCLRGRLRILFQKSGEKERVGSLGEFISHWPSFGALKKKHTELLFLRCDPKT